MSTAPQENLRTARSSLAPRATRWPVFRNAMLLIGAAKQSVALKNISETGAKIQGLNRGLLPAYLVLVEPTLNLRRRVQVIWQMCGAAGLKFLD